MTVLVAYGSTGGPSMMCCCPHPWTAGAIDDSGEARRLPGLVVGDCQAT